MSETWRDPVMFYRAHANEFATARRDNRSEGDWLDAFMDLLPHGGSVLDAGCGTGEPIARKLAHAGFRVIGFDITPTFLALAREGLPQGEFLAADLRSFDFGRSFDGVIAWRFARSRALGMGRHVPADPRRG